MHVALMDGTVNEAIQARAREAFAIYASGIEQALSPGRHVLVGNDISLADICFATETAAGLFPRGLVLNDAPVLREHCIQAGQSRRRGPGLRGRRVQENVKGRDLAVPCDDEIHAGVNRRLAFRP
jgi:glutathione S-transferase